MFNSSKLISVFIILMSLYSCSKPGGTKAGVKLNVSGISGLSATAGSGGTLLFGRSASGDLFGKIIIGMEDTLNVPNGDWMFYALMWDTNTSGLPMNDKVICAKVPAKLSGTDTSLTFNLNNSTCSDPDFSNGRYYTSGGLVRFADIFLEECDDVNATTNWFCGGGNQGSALSYRLKFQNFNKPGNGPFGFGAETITSSCKKVSLATPSDDIMNQGLPVNFPSGNGVSPFVVSVEFFVGTSTCDTTDAKGVHTVLLNNGLGAPAATPSKVLTSTTNCSFSTPDYPVDQIAKQNLCEAYYGNWTGSTCNAVPMAITRFAPTCSSQIPGQTPAIKHLVAMPKPFLCDRYVNSSTTIGTHPFAGGNGTIERPYKICTEWQLNQIGEKTALGSYATSSYKLMNNLDMNKTDFGPYSKPQCVGVASSLVDQHHNFNPLDHVSSDCTTFDNSTSFQGIFDGSNKVISNIRIQAKSVVGLGFVKYLSGTGRIKNLFLKDVEVRGKNQIGGIAGIINGSNNVISNIFIEKLRAEAQSNNNVDGNYVGGIAGTVTYNTTTLMNVHVSDSDIRGRDYVGGLVGQNSGQILKSHFRGQVSTDQGGATSIGGLVGRHMTGAMIKNSFSEGALSSGSSNNGGIAGTSSGSITSAYSTMTVDSYASGATNIGGIVGDNSGGTVTDVLFDGVLNYSGNGGTPTMNGVFVLGSGGTNCYSTVSPASGGCSVQTASSIRTTLPAFTTPADWILTAGSIPRQAWEQRECLLASNQQSVLNQVGTLGRGSETNPVVICKATQLSDLSGRAATEFYRIADDINLSSSWTTPSSTIPVFNGTLNGMGKILYGLNLSYVVGDNPNSYEGIFRSVSSTGVIGNLKLYNNTLSNTAGLGDLGTGLLAGDNLGTIGGIEILNSKVNGENKIGMAVGHNENLLKKIMVERGNVSGKVSTGGIAGANSTAGNILKSRADVKVDSSMAGAFEQFGGITGTNNGSLDQVTFDGELNFTSATSAPNGLRAGGIAGLNTGTITNALADNRSRLRAADTHVVGGLVGESSGSVNLSLAMGKVIYSNAGAAGTASDYFHPVVGYNNGGTIGAYVYYLENKIASFRNTANTTMACVGDGSNCSVNTAPASGSDLFDFSFGGGGGSLSTLTPMATSSSIINYTGSNMAINTQLDFFSSYVLSDTSDSKTLTELTTLATYCPEGFSNSTATGVCSGGFNIAQMGGIGSDRILDFFKASMYNTAPAPNAPIWEFSTGEGPRLLQIHD